MAAIMMKPSRLLLFCPSPRAALRPRARANLNLNAGPPQGVLDVRTSIKAAIKDWKVWLLVFTLSRSRVVPHMPRTHHWVPWFLAALVAIRVRIAGIP
jgi:hypothetical protein